MTGQTVKRVLFAFGTRPEAIKMAPLVEEIRRRRDVFSTQVCVTAQHRQMLDQVLEVFAITPDYDLDIMKAEQCLPLVTARIIIEFDDVLARASPNIVIVQGDTTTTFACALAAFYRKIPVAHIEAGLRTANRFSPFPEEVNRRMTGCLSDWHFAPTERARQALLKESYPEANVFVTGNTVIDALLIAVERVRLMREKYASRFPFLAGRERMVLITGHRRESFGAGLDAICAAIRSLSEANPEVIFVYPVHLNPNVQGPVKRILSGIHNVHLIPPQLYLDFVWLMDRSDIVLTDSGGVQEEAPSLGKPVVVMRDLTERMEAITAGVAVLAGTDSNAIVSSVSNILQNRGVYMKMAKATNPFGDGRASQYIADVLAAAH